MAQKQTSKIDKATALKYDGINAPEIVAQGIGELAREIVRIAEDNDVYLHEDPILSEVLSKLELGDEIPQQLYLAVAKIIAFAYGLKGMSPKTTTLHENNPAMKKLEHKKDE